MSSNDQHAEQLRRQRLQQPPLQPKPQPKQTRQNPQRSPSPRLRLALAVLDVFLHVFVVSTFVIGIWRASYELFVLLKDDFNPLLATGACVFVQLVSTHTHAHSCCYGVLELYKTHASRVGCTRPTWPLRGGQRGSAHPLLIQILRETTKLSVLFVFVFETIPNRRVPKIACIRRT